MSRFKQADDGGNERDEETGSGEKEEKVERGQSDSSAARVCCLVREHDL